VEGGGDEEDGMDDHTIGRRFTGKVAVVAGASTDPGIGTASARRLAAEGASVVINARDEVRLRATEQRLRSEGLEVVAVAGSAGAEGTAERLVDRAVEAFGRIDVVVNAVGGVPFVGSALDLGRDDLLATVALNTWPALSLIQAAMARGLADGGGSVVNISSGSPQKTTPTMAAYAAAKSALNALTRTLANDLGRRGVRVNAVSPGLTRTEATRDLWDGDDGAAAGARMLLGRLTEADDVAAAVAFLGSDEAGAITGVLLDVDAGNHVDTGSWSPFSPDALGRPGGASGPSGSRVT
jgi:NAD(P)-dependent dehydrogenase (short-subunit alcohol dehydrogenase family)